MGTSVAGFERANRLRRSSEFQRLTREGRQQVTRSFVLVAASGAHPEHAERTRLGVAVGRRVGGAVLRNRVKRRLRALAEGCLPEMAQAGYDYVLIGRRATIERSFPALQNDLLTALKRVHKPSLGIAPSSPGAR